MKISLENNKKKLLNKLNINNSFSARLSFYVILLTALLFVGASIAVSNYSRKLIKKEAIRNASNQLKATNLEIETILLGVSVAIDNLSEEVVEQAELGNRENIFEITKKVVKQNEHIIGSDIALEPYYFPDTKYFSPYSFDRGDSIITTQVGCDSYAYQYMEWYQIPKYLKRPYWTDPFFDEGAGNIMMCTYTRPLYDSKNNFIGVLTADLPINWLTEMVNSIKPYKSSYNLMIGKSGAYIVHTNPERLLNETVFTATMNMADTSVKSLGRKMVRGETGMVTLQNDDTLSYVFYAPVPSTGWSLAMVCPHRDVYEGVITMTRIMFWVAILGLTLLFFFDRKIIGMLAKPLAIFSKSARTIAEGNFNVELPEIKTQDEMRDLRDSLKYMQTSLSTYIEELQTTTSAKERIESELSIARNIQMGMIPKIFPPFPERNDIDLFAMLRPAKEVGGDLYDFFIDEEKLYFAIGDVSGKGVPASLFMAVTRSLFRSVATTLKNPKIIVESMNVAISETNEANMFVTMFVGILNLQNGELYFCNAGHNPPCIMKKDGTVRFMNLDKNLPIGLFKEFQYTVQSTIVEEDEILFLYTDGLTEAENPDKRLYSDDRLIDTLKDKIHLDAETLIRDVLASVEEHVDNAPQSDDLTMLVVKYNGKNINTAKGERRIVIKNQISELKLLESFIEKIGEDLKLGVPLVMSLNLAMEEAVSNVIFYAYPSGEDNHTIEILFNKKGKEITFVVQDSGVPFDPTAKEDADITLSCEERNIGGLGIYMVKQIMTSVSYQRKEDKNILTMKKSLE
jgi:phosphoserine phosphatase RsbU/P